MSNVEDKVQFTAVTDSETKSLKERIKFQLEFMMFMMQVDRMEEANSAWANALELIDQIED